MRRLLALSLLAILVPPPAGAQATEVPPFAEGPVRLYAHASANSLVAWMSTLQDDGTTPYYLTGAPTSTTGVAMDPAADTAFTARIPLTPTLGQDIVIAGTINVQAYIGGGTYTAGVADIGTSLAVAGATVASAAAKQHTMTPSQAGTTYNPISWTMTVPETTIPAGTLVEWVISGTITAGNNVYLSAASARGSSYIELPVVSAASVIELPGIQYEDVAFPVSIDHMFGEPTTQTFVLNWTSPGGDLVVNSTINATQGAVALQILLDGQEIHAANATGQEIVAGVAAGNATLRLTYSDFLGSLNLTVSPALALDGPTEPEPPVDVPSGTGNETIDPADKDTPLPWLAAVAALLVVAVRRRRA